MNTDACRGARETCNRSTSICIVDRTGPLVVDRNMDLRSDSLGKWVSPGVEIYSHQQIVYVSGNRDQ